MAEATVTDRSDDNKKVAGNLVARIAWRNLWRNRRRTWLTAGGIAFASVIVSFAMAMQLGVYGAMIANSTLLLEGHMQVTHRNYPDDTKMEQTVTEGTELVRELDRVSGVSVAPRVEAYALISADERSFAGLVVGVDFDREPQVVTIFDNIKDGRLPSSDDEVFIGATMARNLGIWVGDELVVLGSAKAGGVAAMALKVAGIYSAPIVEIERTMIFAPLTSVQNAFALADEVHKIVLKVSDAQNMERELARVASVAGADRLTRPWSLVMPELNQSIELDWLFGRILYGAILMLVSFSVINTFVMIVFERTREFGMLMAVGMRPGLIIRQVLTEALFVWLVGVALGLLIATCLIGWYYVEGVPVGDMGGMMDEFGLSDRLYPVFELQGFLTAPLVLLIGTQLAGVLATLKIRRINALEALRAD